MKKVVFIILLFSIIISLSVTVYAYEIDTDNLVESTSDILSSIIDDEIIDTLEELGIDVGDIGSVYNFSSENITEFFAVTLKDRAQKCLKDVLLLLCVVLITGTISGLFVADARQAFISQMSVIIVTLLMVSSASESLSAVISAIRLSGNFMTTYIPIYTLLISLSGNAASALTYNSLVLSFAELLSGAISYIIPDVIGVLFCLSISFSLNESINVSRFINAVNKAVSVIFGTAAGAFTGFLGLKNILTVSMDSVSVKSIRFLISSLIPVVGSSISEAYSTLLGSINLIKGSVAVIGILVIVIINLPIVAETLFYYISFTALSYLSDSFSVTGISDALRSFSCGMRILMLLLVFEVFILIISTGIVLVIKGGI